MKKVLIITLCFSAVGYLVAQYEPIVSVEIEPEFSAPKITKKKNKLKDHNNFVREPSSIQQNYEYPSSDNPPPDYWAPAMEEPYEEPMTESEFPTDEAMVDEGVTYVDEAEVPPPEQVEVAPDSSIE